MDAPFFRSQAALCRRIGRRFPDERIAAELIRMAEEFAARAATLEPRHGEDRERPAR